MGYYDSLPPSFGEKNALNDVGGASIKNGFKGETVSEAFADPKFGVDTEGRFDSVADSLTGARALAPKGGWTFITAPEDISWDVSNRADRVDMFGTNNPPVVAGSRGMRDLKLGNALVEGFVRGVTVEGKVAALENLLNYGLNSSDGFVSVPVYQVWANKKSYGGPQAYYIIKDVNVKETMRDLQGNATRAYVDISLMQVPAYQVNSGRDQAKKNLSGAGAGIKQEFNDRAEQVAKNAAGEAAGKAAAAGQNAAKPQTLRGSLEALEIRPAPGTSGSA